MALLGRGTWAVLTCLSAGAKAGVGLEMQCYFASTTWLLLLCDAARPGAAQSRFLAGGETFQAILRLAQCLGVGHRLGHTRRS